MGLAICKRICEIHGGTIALDSDYLGGTRFVVRLPRAQPKSAKSAER
jgi:signal transduction histidine kinase